MPDEHEQYPMLRALTESAEEIEVPAVIVRELFAERDALVADRDRLLADRPFQHAAILALTDERDRLQARLDAYEGDLKEWEHIEELIRDSSLGTAAAESLRNRTPPGLGKALALGSQYLARAEAAETERGQLRAALRLIAIPPFTSPTSRKGAKHAPVSHVGRSTARTSASWPTSLTEARRRPMSEYPHDSGDVIVLGPQVFVSRDEAVLNWKGCNYVPQDIVAERNELQAVVDAARAYLALVDSTRVTAQDRQAGMIDLRRALRQLDGSADMGGVEKG